jgi:hypothetical protein
MFSLLVQFSSSIAHNVVRPQAAPWPETSAQARPRYGFITAIILSDAALMFSA